MDHATLKWSQRELCGLLVQAVSGQVLAALERLVTSVFERFPSRVDRTFGREVLVNLLSYTGAIESSLALNPRSQRIESDTPRNRSISVRL